jgi:hypothetical protein
MSIKIENIVTPSDQQWEAVIMGARNPYDSWEKSDSCVRVILGNCAGYNIGEADLKRLRNLAKAGSDHRKYLRQLPVIMDIKAPLFWWKEADQYKVGTVTDSCSTMHTIARKEFTFDDFSWDTSLDKIDPDDGYLFGISAYLGHTINVLNQARNLFNKTGNQYYWRIMIENLPSSYNQKRTFSCNYEVLWNMYQARKNHKLQEWRDFCAVIVHDIPYFADIFEIEVK